MAELYVSSAGNPVLHHSFSASSDLHFCNYFYYSKRVAGWKDKDRKASLEFGKAIEDAVRFHHENNLEGGAEYFTKTWEQHKDDHELIYTALEDSWSELNDSGREMLELYAILLPKLPFSVNPPPRFQSKFSKEVFPGTELAGIDFVAYVDMLANLRSGERILIDIKTSGVMLPETPGILALDQQLRTYSWVTGISQVGFLAFVKTNRNFEKGSNVSFLRNVLDVDGSIIYKAGSRAVVAQFIEADLENNQEEKAWIVRDDLILDEMKKFIGDKPTSKLGKEKKAEFLAQNASLVSTNYLTKQRIQFLTAVVDEEAQQECATNIGADIATIVEASKTGYFPKRGGVRYPKNVCVNCACLGLCLKNEALRDARLKRDDEGVFEESGDE